MNAPPDRPDAEGGGVLSLEAAAHGAHQAFAEDLHQLVNCADQRFADVCWNILPSDAAQGEEDSRGNADALTAEARQAVASPAAAGQQGSQSLLYAHKALLFARAPQTFQRAFQLLPSNVPSSEPASASASASASVSASAITAISFSSRLERPERPDGPQSFSIGSTAPGSSSPPLDTKFKRTHRHRISQLRSRFPPSSFANPTKSTHPSSSLDDSDTESDHPTLSASTGASDTERESDSPAETPGFHALPVPHAHLPTLKKQFMAQRQQLRPIPLPGASYDVLRDSLVYLYTAAPEQAVAFDFLYNDHSLCSTATTDIGHSARPNLHDLDFGTTSMISPDNSPLHQLQLQEQLRGDLAYMWRSKLYADVSIVLDPTCVTSSSASSSHSHRPTSSIASTKTTVSAQSLPMDMEDENDDTLTFSAHRFILATRSMYFAERLLSHSLHDEPGRTTEATTILRLPPHPFSPIALHFTLGFLYTGSLTFSSRRFDLTTAMQILHASNFLSIPSLAPLVASMISEAFCHQFACVVPCSSCDTQSHAMPEPTSTAVAGSTTARRVRIQTNAGPQPDVEPQPGPCERCRRRVPKVLAFTYTEGQCSPCARAQVSVSSANFHGPHSTGSDAFHTQLKLLRQASQEAVTGPWFGAYWNKDIGNLPTEVRSMLVRGIAQRVQSNPELVVSTVEQLTLLAHRLQSIASELAGSNKGGSVRKKRAAWIEHVHWMAQSVETTVQEVLATQLDAVIIAPSWDNLLRSHSSAAHETLDKVLVMLLDGLTEAKAPLAYQVLARPTVPHVDSTQLDRLQGARGGVMRYLRRRWRAAVAVDGFQSLELGTLKEIVRQLGVKLEVLNPELVDSREPIKSPTSPTPTSVPFLPKSSSTKSMSMGVKRTTSFAQNVHSHASASQRTKAASAQPSTSKLAPRIAALPAGTRSLVPHQTSSSAGQAGSVPTAAQARLSSRPNTSRPTAPGTAPTRSTSIRSSRPSTAPIRSRPATTQPNSSASISRATRPRPPPVFTATARVTPTTVRSPIPFSESSLGAQIPFTYRVPPTPTKSTSSNDTPSGRSSSLGSTTSSNTATSTNTSTSNGSSVRVPGPSPSTSVRSSLVTKSTQSTQSTQATKSTQPTQSTQGNKSTQLNSAASNLSLPSRARRPITASTRTTTSDAPTTRTTQVHTPIRTHCITSMERTIVPPQSTSNEDKDQQKTPTTIRVRSSPSTRSSSDRTPRANHLQDLGRRTHSSVPDQDPTPTASRVYPVQQIESSESESDSDSDSGRDGSQATRRSGSPTPMATPRARQCTARTTKSPTKSNSLAAKLGISPQRIDSPLVPGRRGNLAFKDVNCARSLTTLKTVVATPNEFPTLSSLKVENPLLAAPAEGTVLYQSIPCVVAPSLDVATRGPPIARFKARVKYLGPVKGQEGTWVGVQLAVPVPAALLSWAWTRQSSDHAKKDGQDGQDARVLLSCDGTWAGETYVPPSTIQCDEKRSFAASTRAVRVARANRNARIQRLLPGGSRPTSRLSLTGSVSDASTSASASESEATGENDTVQRTVVFVRPEDVLYVETDL